MEDEQQEEKLILVKFPLESEIFNESHFRILQGRLPGRLQTCEWKLLYSLRKHGASFRTMLYNCREKGESLMFVKPTNHKECEFIGGFISAQDLHIQPLYFGNAETFVFRYMTKNIESFHWTGHDRFFVHCSSTGIGLGGGSNFALHIDEQLRFCSSGYSETFGNPALLNDKQSQYFECLNIEIWGFEN